jgi:L-histidine N-alpha-methyltransferase
MPTTLEPLATALHDAVLHEALTGLDVPAGAQKTLTPWLFYDEFGSQLFEQITALPEYYLTRTERSILAAHADEIFMRLPPVTIAELGAGTAAKTGVLLAAAARFQREVLYQPIDVSATALDDAARSIAANFPGVTIAPQVGNYITDTFTIARPPHHAVLALYIGSSIGNFSPLEAQSILTNLRARLVPGDALLLGTDLAPAGSQSNGVPRKAIATLLTAYNDAAGVTAAFNRNVLVRLNRELGANFNLDCFVHRVRWNAAASRMEMHLESVGAQTVQIDGHQIQFAAGETIHTENSRKFTDDALRSLLTSSGFTLAKLWHDPAHNFAVSLAEAV